MAVWLSGDGDGVPNAARQLSGERGREGSGENSRRLSRRIAQIGIEVLRHQRERGPRPHLPHEGVGRYRAEACEALLPQSGETKISESRELLRADGGARRAGPHPDPARAARGGGDEGRGGHAGEPHLSGSLESRAFPGTDEEQSNYGGRL